ncbi:MAG: hypothetical protein QOI40_1390 [Alphaproteobacteria bacterium]|jgi:hypothetical protein|nr:hypothetical protein [Alphaproteobacteria bacterium]
MGGRGLGAGDARAVLRPAVPGRAGVAGTGWALQQAFQ